MPRRPRNTTTYTDLEQRLVLLAWLHERLGYKTTAELLDAAKQADEGYDGDGRSYACKYLLARQSGLDGMTPGDLERYDDNIRNHLDAMNAGRPQPITLRYFQYLAALYAEIFLDAYFTSAATLKKSLNALIARRNISPGAHGREADYEDPDLTKLAFWMATGSGKTLIMHLNYRQFLHYNRRTGKPLDNILLITPNEALTEQHLQEFAESNIPATRLDPNRTAMFLNERDIVQVTEITKLAMEKRGEGESVSVDTFEGNNLVFVDEGHKGSGGDAWRQVREALADTGFTFEYSATFGQALTAARNDQLSAEYGKAIAFDYSYRYFHNDGYGKDFQILNLRQGDTAERTDRLLLANMLSFYEQRLAFDERADCLRPYNLDRPLWIFVGSSVNAVYTRNKQPRSDVLTVARFFNRALLEPAWAIGVIGDLLEGHSGIIGEDSQDLFADRLGYLRGRGQDANIIYQDVRGRVLHAPSGGGLHIADMRGHEGELGLKVGNADDYFGLIYIGDTSKFKNLVSDHAPDITIEEDAISDSLFDEIAEPDTTIETLIGSRKFTEGWNSWRVSNMGLLNMGRSEGSQIIQIFGRGVRLRGLDFSLKRSSAIDGDHPDHLELLETLNIFSVRADYMEDFRNYLEREGVPTLGSRQLDLFIEPNVAFFETGLVIPRVDDGRDFAAETQVLLKRDPAVRSVFVDMSAHIQTIIGSDGDVSQAQARSGRDTQIPTEILKLVDWDRAYLGMVEHMEMRDYKNFLFTPDDLEELIVAGSQVYTLRADEELIHPKTYENWELLQEAVLNILRRYADAFYRHRREAWESDHMAYRKLNESDPNLTFNAAVGDNRGKYVISVPRSETLLIENIERLLDDRDILYNNEGGDPPRIHFDQHIYQPLLLDKDARIEISPPGLNESERQFVYDLRDYWKRNHADAMQNREIFLLRNQSKGTGVGFFQHSGFYPDFILWIKTGDAQRIVFVEPHGMIYSDHYDYDEKASLHERLPEIANRISNRSPGYDVSLDSYIVSSTSYADLHKKKGPAWDRDTFANHHILFPEQTDDYDYIAEILG